MTVLRTIEQKIEGLFEGIFGRAFRTHVQPVELARKLAKEMDDHRTISISKVYVPNEYTVYLSPEDREQFTAYETALVAELAEYLSEHARREGYALMTRPQISMETDDDLAVGEFGIATRMVQPEGAEEPAPAPGATMLYRPAQPIAEDADAEAGPVQREVATITVDGERREIEKRTMLIGRSKECDIQVGDANVSRRHAEIRQEGATYWVVDLDSTNGTEVNGRPTKRAKLQDGDTIVVGSTELTFRREPAE